MTESDILNHYKNYIWKIAKKLSSNKDNEEDLVQEAYLSLIKAVRSYNQDKGNLHNYIIKHIKYSMIGFKNNNNLIKIPNNARYESHNNYKESKIIVKDVSNSDLNLDTNLSYIHSTDKIDNEIILNNINKLNENDRNIIIMYYYEYLTFKEIGAKLNISKQAANVRFHKALKRLRLMIY